MPVEVVPFEPRHHEEVLALSLRAWEPVFAQMREAVLPFAYDAFYPKGWEVRQSHDIEAFLRDEGRMTWVAMDGPAVAGWIGLRLHPDDGMGEVYILAVDPERQRKGIANTLLAFAMGHFRAAGAKMLMVETGGDPGHAPSRAAYEQAGFERWPVARYFRKL